MVDNSKKQRLFDDDIVQKKSIQLSEYFQALVNSILQLKKKPRPDDLSVINVSQTASLFALVYERVRNAVEFREDHLILRASIERILKRRISLNPSGQGEGENILRELLWARYFDVGELGMEDAIEVQKIIDIFIELKNKAFIGRNLENKDYYYQFLIDLTTAEIEELLLPYQSEKKAVMSYFIFQVLRRKIKIEGVSELEKDTYFLVAIEKTYRRSDRAYQRYHLFINLYKRLKDLSKPELEKLATKIVEVVNKIDSYLTNPYVEKLSKYCRKQLAPFLVLFDLIEKKRDEIGNLFLDEEKLWIDVELLCREKYQNLSRRIKNLSIRSFIYIFLTKMIFALILEIPLSNYFYQEISWRAVAINTIFPPILMILIVGFFKIPGDDNTKKIFQRIIEIINRDPTFETKVAYMPKRPRPKKPALIFGFTVLYSLTFIITFGLIYEILSLLEFNLISQAVFIFFVSIVTFFSYRVKQLTSELKLQEKESILTPIFDFFFMPILSLGKFLSQEISRLNFFIFLFDFIIEAPFKLLVEVVEEWINFVKKRKEEIA